jgi:hypothetical protein
MVPKVKLDEYDEVESGSFVEFGESFYVSFRVRGYSGGGLG